MVKRHCEMQRKIDQHQNVQVHYTQWFKEFCCHEIRWRAFHITRLTMYYQTGQVWYRNHTNIFPYEFILFYWKNGAKMKCMHRFLKWHRFASMLAFSVDPAWDTPKNSMNQLEEIENLTHPHKHKSLWIFSSFVLCTVMENINTFWFVETSFPFLVKQNVKVPGMLQFYHSNTISICLLDIWHKPN